jgi:hypothetical protein
MLTLLLAAAAAGGPSRLILVGDTGVDGPHPVAAAVAQAITDRLYEVPGTRLVALGDLFYDRPPIELPPAECVAAVVARYRQFYDAPTAAHPDGYPDDAVIYAVAGNHDVAGGAGWSVAATACTAAAFAQLGWRTGADGIRLTSRVDAWPEADAELMLVEEHRQHFDGAPDTSAAWSAPDPAWRIAMSHYPLLTWSPKNDETPPANAAATDFDLWLAGHAHVLQVFYGAAPAGQKVAAITSGATPASYPSKKNPGTPKPLFELAGTQSEGGYVILDLEGDRLTVTPVVCTAAGCADEGPLRFHRAPGGRGVRKG